MILYNGGAITGSQHSGVGFLTNSIDHIPCRDRAALCLHDPVLPEEGGTHSNAGQVCIGLTSNHYTFEAKSNYIFPFLLLATQCLAWLFAGLERVGRL